MCVAQLTWILLLSTLLRLQARKGDDGHEAHVSAKYAPAEEDAWLPRAHEDERRAKDTQASPREGAQTPDRVGGRLPRRERLTTSAEFQALFHRGKRIDRPSFLVLWAEGDHARRVGFAVSRRMSRAVDRNRIRRRLREAYRATRDSAPVTAAMVVVGKQRVLEMKFGALVEELQGVFATMSASASVRAGDSP